MPIDQTASVAENIVQREKLKITFSVDGRKVAVASRLFYEKGFVLFKRSPGENVASLVRDVDYRLIFKVPGLRSINGRFGMYAGLELLSYESDAEYFIAYRSVGASATFSEMQLREHFETNSQVHLITFHALLLTSGAAPTALDLENSSAVLQPHTLNYGSLAGLAEMTAKEAQIVQSVTVVSEGGGSSDDDEISDGGMF